MQINSIDKAIIAYNSILANNQNDGFSHVGLAECYRINGDLNNSFNELKQAFNSEDIPSDIKFNMLLSIIKTGSNDDKIQEQAYELTQVLVELYPNDVDIATIYANFLLRNGELKEAYKYLFNVTKVSKDRYAVWEQIILLDNEFADWNSMFNNTNEALKYFPNQSFLYFFNGFSAYQIGKYNKSVKSLSFGYKLITKADPLILDYLTFLGEGYYKLDDKPKSFEYFDKVLKIDPHNLMVLNNYAYYLSIDNIQLEKAEAMSKITIEKEPKNATYLDTYAWILFKLKKNQLALNYMTQAIENSNIISDVVYEHYGDILFHNSKTEQAVDQWNNARNSGEGSGLLDKKINNRMYFE